MSDVQTRLQDAETALHALMTGSMMETVERDGVRITYTRTNIGDLRRYIAELRSQQSSAATPRRRALHVQF